MKLVKNEHKNMFKIYTSDISKFEEIAKYEDYNKNIKRFLMENFCWKDKFVFEAGIGIGRITQYYINSSKKIIATDISQSMLDFCKKKFADYKNKIRYVNLRHLDMKDKTFQKADIFISSYSLSFEIINEDKPIQEIYNILMDGIKKVTKKGALIIIIENEGIFNELPSFDYRMKDYFTLLNNEFKHMSIDTSYLFNSIEEAVKILNNFFGKEISSKVEKYNNCNIPEKSGIWYKYI